MNKLNKLLLLTSLVVVLVSIERFSFTARVVLQPYSFLRLHEVFQITVLILLTTIIPFFVFKELTNNFTLLRKRNGVFLATIFIIGIYFYATGNGVHELGSYIYNSFCLDEEKMSTLCGVAFFNDYYFGNILYFIGGVLMGVPLLIFEQMKGESKLQRKQLVILIANSLVFSLAIFAYAGFDKVLVGLVYSIIMTVISLYFLFRTKTKIGAYPYALYSAVAYSVGTSLALLVRTL